MGKKISIIFFTTVIFTLLTFTLNTFNVGAIENIDVVQDNSAEQFISYLSSVDNTDEDMSKYYQDMLTVINYYYPNFNVDPLTFGSTVKGSNSYKILEVTPRSYLGDPNNENNFSTVSDLYNNLETIKSIYATKVLANNFTDRFVLSNMPKFEVQLMTIKEFVANRDELSGVYDAIVFTGSENYNPGEQISCTFSYDLSQLEYKRIYDGNNKLRYEGYFLGDQYHGKGKVYDQNSQITYNGQFNNGIYHGKGDLYNQNGVLIYSGGWDNGKKECYGKIYDQNGRLNYEGKWQDDLRNGYGTSYDQNGNFDYEGYWIDNVKQPTQTSLDLLNDITALKANEVIDHFVKKGLPVFIHEDVFHYENSNFNTYFKNLSTQYPNNVFSLKYPVSLDNNNMSLLETLAIMTTTEVLSTKPYLDFEIKPIDYYTNETNTYKATDVLNFKFELTNKERASMYFYIDINQNNVIEKNEIADSKVLLKGNNLFDFELPQVMSGLLKYQIVVEEDGLLSKYDGTIRVKGENRTINVVNIVSEMVFNKNNLLNNDLVDLYFKNNGDYNINIISCNVKDLGNNDKKNNCSHSKIFDLNNSSIDVVLLGQDIFDKNLNTPTYNSIQAYVDGGKPLIFTSSITKGKEKWQDYFSDELLLADYRTDSYKINNANRLQVMNINSYNSYPFNIVKEDLIVPEDLNYAFNENFQLNLEEIELVPLLNMYKDTPYNLDRFDAYNNFYYMQANNVVYLNIGNNSYKTYKDIEHKLLANAISNLFVERNAKQAELQDYFSINLSEDYNNALINVTDPINFDFTILTNLTVDETYHYLVKIGSNIVIEGDLLKNVNQNVILANIANPNVNEVTEAYISIEITDSENRQIYDYGFKVYVANIQNYLNVTQSLNVTDTSIIDNQIGVNSLYNLKYNLNFLNLDFTNLNNNNLPQTLILNDIQFKEILPANIAVQNLDSSFNVVKNENNETVITKTLPNVTLNYVNGKYVPSINNNLTITIPIKVTSVGTYNINQGTVSVNGITTDVDHLTLGNVEFDVVKVLDDTLVRFNFNEYLFIPFNPTGSNYAYLPEMISIDPDIRITSIHFNVLGEDNKFEFNSSTNNLTAKAIGISQVEVVVKDIFGKEVQKVFTVMSYEPVHSININNFSLYINQEVLILNNQIPLKFKDSLQYTVRNLNTTSTDPVIEIIYCQEEGLYYIKALRTGSAEVTFTGYDYQGNQITETGVIIVKEPSSLQFNKNYKYIPLFINGTFNLNDIVDLSECTLVTGCTFADITWTSSDQTIATVDAFGLIHATTKAGYAIIEGKLPNNDTAQILVKVSDFISDASGFDDEKLQNRNLYDNYTYNLENFMRIFNIDPNTVSYVFTSEILKGNGTVNINENNEMIVTIADFESITVKLTVTITQIIPDGEDKVVNDSVVITINGGTGNF
ncbi:MAG: bacterial Ig-like domain family protein [Haloplasmataceae bacterium]|nr:bacterial Ig-like domain family protein [Haloplasmataceae bacterium]